jgi:hypothetical protein
MATVKNVDKWVNKFASSAGTQGEDRSSFQQQGEQVFQSKPKPTWQENVQGVKDVAQEVGMGIFAAPAKAVNGLLGLVSPEAADAVQDAGNKFKSFQEENSPGGPNQLSPEAKALAFGGGQLAAGLASAPIVALGPKTTGMVSGWLAGLSSREEGDTRGDTLKRGAIGAGVGLGTAAVMQAVPATLGYAKDKIGGWLKTKPTDEMIKKAADAATLQARAVDDAFKKEIFPVYKQMGIPLRKMSPDELQANQKFIDSFKGEFSAKVNNQFKEALVGVQAPPKVVSAFNEVEPEVLAAAKNFMYKSTDEGMVQARKAPGTLKYFDELSNAMTKMQGSAGGNEALRGKLVQVMKDESTDYAKAFDLYNTKKSLAANLGGDLYKSIRSDKVAKITPLAQELAKTPQGAEVVNKTFLQGMRSELVANSNKPPLEQLRATLGRNPAEAENTLNFLRSTGQTDVAEKFTSLLDFTNTVSKIGPKNQSISAKMINKGLGELNGKDLSTAVMTLMDSNKFSKEFSKIMQEQADHLIRSEKTINLLGRAFKSTYDKNAPKVVKSLVSGVSDVSKMLYEGRGSVVPMISGYNTGSSIQNQQNSNGDNQ